MTAKLHAAFLVRIAPLLLLGLVSIQLSLFVRDLPGAGEPWFLFGTDTLTHDAIVHQWVQGELSDRPFSIPLWMPGIQGGLPTLGAFLWTPFSPQAWPFHFFHYSLAQRLAWTLCLWLGAWGAFVLGRSMRLSVAAALVVAVTWGLSGHVVTLIHAGHFQKVMALSWLPWMAAGAVVLSRPHALGRAAAGAVILAGAFALMLLAGHPQIAYTGAIVAGGLVVWEAFFRRKSQERHKRAWSLLVGGFVLGLALSAAQFLPGYETAALSTRAAGIGFEEATATSYPPAEVLEYAVPRHQGSSVMGDVYTGEWGDERIVSDYIGLAALLLAFLAIFGRLERLYMAFYWLLAAGFFLLIGFGSYTPVYRAFYETLPFFDGFRSPGTFMAGTSLAIAVLAGMGTETIRGWLRLTRARRYAPAVLAGIVIIQAADLMRANRHFLIAFPWDRYEVEFLAPRDLDVYLEENDLQLEVHDLVNELSLRPILFGGRAVNGYHPITYAAKQELDEVLELHTLDWFRAWGITHVLVPAGAEPEADITPVADFPEAGRRLLALPEPSPHTVTDPPARYQWIRRSAAGRHLRIATEERTLLRVHDVSAPGTWVLRTGKPVKVVSGSPLLFTEFDVPSGEHAMVWLYKPDSYRVGLFLSALGAAAAGLMLSASRRRPRGG